MCDLISMRDVFETEEKPACKGKLFRYSKNEFLNSRGEYVITERMRPLKRRSCTGCEKCSWLDEVMQEDLNCGIEIYIDDPEVGAVYDLCVYESFTDWETGICDDFSVGFIRCKDEESPHD